MFLGRRSISLQAIDRRLSIPPTLRSIPATVSSWETMCSTAVIMVQSRRVSIYYSFPPSGVPDHRVAVASNSYVAEILPRLWQLLPFDDVHLQRPIFPIIIERVLPYTCYRSVARSLIRSLAALAKKGVVVYSSHYPAHAVEIWKDLEFFAQNRYTFRLECDLLCNICFTVSPVRSGCTWTVFDYFILYSADPYSLGI